MPVVFSPWFESVNVPHLLSRVHLNTFQTGNLKVWTMSNHSSFDIFLMGLKKDNHLYVCVCMFRSMLLQITAVCS